MDEQHGNLMKQIYFLKEGAQVVHLESAHYMYTCSKDQWQFLWQEHTVFKDKLARQWHIWLILRR